MTFQFGEGRQGQSNIFGQGHGTEQRPALVRHPHLHHQPSSLFGAGIPKAEVLVKNAALRRLFQPYHVPQQGAFATAAAAHDNENIAPIDGEVHVALDNHIAIGHGQVGHGDVRFAHAVTISC